MSQYIVTTDKNKLGMDNGLNRIETHHVCALSLKEMQCVKENLLHNIHYNYNICTQCRMQTSEL